MELNLDYGKILQNYYKLACNEESCKLLVQDEACMMFLSYIIDDNNPNFTMTTIEIVNKLIDNPRMIEDLAASFGLLEALESVKVKYRSDNPTLSEMAEATVKKMLSLNIGLDIWKRNNDGTSAFAVSLPNLEVDNRRVFESIITNIKGVLSLVLDIEKQRGIIRISNTLNPLTLLEQVKHKLKVSAQFIGYDKDCEEFFIDDLKDLCNAFHKIDDYDDPNMAIAADNAGDKNTTFFDGITSFFKNSFYW